MSFSWQIEQEMVEKFGKTCWSSGIVEALGKAFLLNWDFGKFKKEIQVESFHE